MTLRTSSHWEIPYLVWQEVPCYLVHFLSYSWKQLFFPGALIFFFFWWEMLLETKIGKLIVLIYTRVYLGTLSSQTSKYTQICVYIQTCIYIFIHTYTYIYIFLHACTYVHVIHMNIFRNYEFLPIQFQSISSELVLPLLPVCLSFLS